MTKEILDKKLEQVKDGNLQLDENTTALEADVRKAKRSKNLKVPKFMICKNELAVNETFILHSQSPRFIGVVKDGKLEIVEMIDKEHKPGKFHRAITRFNHWYKAYQKRDEG